MLLYFFGQFQQLCSRRLSLELNESSSFVGRGWLGRLKIWVSLELIRLAQQCELDFAKLLHECLKLRLCSIKADIPYEEGL